MLLHTQRCKSGVDTLYAGGVGRCEDGVSGSRGFLRFPCFFVLHLGNAYRVRVHGKALCEQILHGYTAGGVVAFIGYKMYDVVYFPAIFVTLNKVKFANGFFDGDKSAVIRNVAHDIRHNCGFSGACRAGIHLRNSVNKRYREELVNFLGAHFTLDELLFCYLAGIYDSYGNRNSHLIAHDERMYSRNSDILVEVASDQRSGSVENQLLLHGSIAYTKE